MSRHRRHVRPLEPRALGGRPVCGWKGRSMRTMFVLVLLLCPWIPADLTAGTKVHLRVESEPLGAMVTVASPDEKAALTGTTVAGETPLEKEFAFGKSRTLTLTFEKRGYAPESVEITPTSETTRVTLRRIREVGQPEIPEFSLPESGVLLLVPPAMKVIKRGFSSEAVDAEASREAESSIVEVTESLFDKGLHATPVAASPENQRSLRSLWRDSRTVMQMTDPIRLPYQARPLFLETRSARKAAAFLGGSGQGEYLLLIEGKQVRDTGGMRLGQLAIMSVGTACSYASGYSRALENGDSFFIYTIYTPSFTSGLTLKSSLLRAATGEVLWANRGHWKSIRFDRAEDVAEVLRELLTGLL